MKDIVRAPEILLPRAGVDLEKWAVVACDQFTSQPEYWKRLEAYLEGAYSTFNLIFPEVYLGRDNSARINSINAAMSKYLADGVFNGIRDSFVLVVRDTAYQKARLGLIMAVDLEAYDYTPFAEAGVRATEGTVAERIPPRVEIRKHAPLELPHIMLLIDDRAKSVIEPLYANRDSLEKLYDTPLNMGGGRVTGYKVSDVDGVKEKLYGLLDADRQLKTYGRVTNFLFAVGDGNHSLATAKAHWDNIKQSLSARELETHPARFALVEVENLYGDALKFEPIHRVIFNGGDKFINEITTSLKGPRKVKMFENGREYTLNVAADSIDAIKEIQDFIDGYIKENVGAEVDYVHGADYLKEVVESKNAIGILMPAPDKESLFDFIIRKGIMPRKSFSMGEAEEKRYYLEAKRIK